MRLRALTCCFILILGFHNAHSLQLLLGADPINSPEILNNELKPIIESMTAKYNMAYVPALTPKELLQQARQGRVNSAYVTPGYGYLLQELGFVPLLVSKEKIVMSLVGKPNFDIAVAKNNSDQKMYYTANDLFSKFHVHIGKYEKQWAAEIIPSMTSENIIFKLLKERSSLGFIMAVDLGLLNENMRDNLFVYESEDVGPLYFMVSAEVIEEWPELEKDFYSFHKNFKDPEGKYNYLNVYHFNYPKVNEIELSVEYSQYLKGLM